jgi:hypothetical protein
MMKYAFATSTFLATVLGMSSGPSVWAKPADLPVDNQIQCPECGEEPPHGKLSALSERSTDRAPSRVDDGKAEKPMAIDSITPSMLPTMVEQLFQQALEFFLPHGHSDIHSGRPAQNNEGNRVTIEEKRARQLFKIAEGCRRKGEIAKARRCYQQVHALSPTSRFGQMAIDRLVELDNPVQEPDNEQNAPRRQEDSEQSYRKLRDRSVPLGLVEVTY